VRVLITGAAILSLIAGVATTAAAQTVKQFQLVGFTEAETQGSEGLLALTQVCQAEFPASRMCTSVEVMNTVALPGALENTNAWVRPVIRAFEFPVWVDASGTTNSEGGLSCDAWQEGSSFDGLAVTERLRFGTRDCGNRHPVACCSLLAVPEPSTSLLQGAAAATLATMVAKRGPTRPAVAPPAPASRK
jgi:hypothetical protein